MEIQDIVSVNHVLATAKPSSKKQLLQLLADTASKDVGVDSRVIFETLLKRERLGSTGLGGGVAIPHGKLSDLKSIVGVFARLTKPIEFEALDDQPVDIAFMLLAPVGSGAEHLKALSRIARVLRNQSLLASIRDTSDGDAIHSLLTSVESSNVAA